VNGEDVATCPSCSLLLKVIYDPDQFVSDEAEQVVSNSNVSVRTEVTAGGSE